MCIQTIISRDQILQTHCHNLTALRNTRLFSSQATARRLTWPNNPLGWDDVTGECGVTLAASSSSHKNTCRMTQRKCRKRLSVPKSTQLLRHAIYSNARTRHLRRHKPLFPWGYSTWSKEIGWCDMGPLAVGVSLVWLVWPTVTAVVLAIMNVTKMTVQTEGQQKYSHCQVPI